MPNALFEKMSIKELIDFEEKVRKAIGSAIERDNAAVRQKIDAIMADAGMTFEDVAELYGFGRGRGARKGTKVPPKYCNPDNENETWTGRGRLPRWLVAKLNNGSTLTDFAI